MLALSLTRIYWASYTDWQNHQLSIDYRVTDNGPGTAYATKVTAATATNGVYLTSPVPVSLGNINQGGYAPFTFKYYIPVGVTSFSATVYSTCSDQNGAGYSFPAKRTSYSYNQANQLTTGYDYQGVSTSYAYDANGAITQKSDGASTTGYAYNGLDKLTEVTTPTTAVNYSLRRPGQKDLQDGRDKHSQLPSRRQKRPHRLRDQCRRQPDGFLPAGRRRPDLPD